MIYLLLFFASLIWGLNVVVMKVLLLDIPFIMLAALRVFISLLFILIYMLMKKMSFYHKDLFKVIIISFFSIYLNFYFTFLAMTYLQGVQIVFINALSPFITCLLTYIFFKHKMSKIQCLSIVITILAFFISIQFDYKMFDIGFLFMFLGLSFYALSHIFVRKMNIEFSFTFIFYQLLFGFIMLFIHSIVTKKFYIEPLISLSINDWILFILFSGLGFAFIQVIYFYAINKVGIFLTSTFLSINPVITYIGSIIFLNETAYLYYNIGVILIVCSLIMNIYNLNKTS